MTASEVMSLDVRGEYKGIYFGAYGYPGPVVEGKAGHKDLTDTGSWSMNADRLSRRTIRDLLRYLTR